MDATSLRAKAERLRALHAPGEILVLPCAWDGASARVFEAQGFPAVGTTSAGMAAAFGLPDGEKIPFAECLAIIGRIAAGVDVPVTADVEAGYGRTTDAVVANMRQVLEAGVVGINIEDEDHVRAREGVLQPVEEMVTRIQAIRAMGEAAGVPIFINAKTDAIWLAAAGDPEADYREAVRRANAYGAAGADCVFVPGDLDLAAISRLADAIAYPLNIVAKEMTPPVAVLRDIGVRRLSLGSGPMRATMGLVAEIARELLSEGTCRTCFDFAMPYAQVQQLLGKG